MERQPYTRLARAKLPVFIPLTCRQKAFVWAASDLFESEWCRQTGALGLLSGGQGTLVSYVQFWAFSFPFSFLAIRANRASRDVREREQLFAPRSSRCSGLW